MVSTLILNKIARTILIFHKFCITNDFLTKFKILMFNKCSLITGCAAFIGIAIYFLTQPPVDIRWEEKLVFGIFFAGAIICLGMSFAYHTVHCHSECVGKLFSKLDYCGIAMLIMGSFVPWLYYGFYCDYQPKVIYLSVVMALGVSSIVVSLWERFGEASYRPLRAGVFAGFGLSGVKEF